MEFQEVLTRCSFSNLGWSGNLFSWSNHRFKKGLIKERLDRFVSNYQWWLRFLGSKVSNLSSVGSDHSPMMLEIMGLDN